jgi:hypothetical protein
MTCRLQELGPFLKGQGSLVNSPDMNFYKYTDAKCDKSTNLPFLDGFKNHYALMCLT